MRLSNHRPGGLPQDRGDGADTQMRRMLTRVKGAFTEEELSHLRTIYDGYYAADPRTGFSRTTA